jgi:nicotinate-nucleotide--dimethylbenzimidazole phosphoribosyltransferase
MNITEQLQNKINNKTKPLGALGELETVAVQIGTLQNTLTPTINKPHIVVFAGDHGIAATNRVNPYPQAVTAQMVLNFVQGGAAINVFCKQNIIDLTVVDAGVNFDFEPSLPIKHLKIAKGTNDYTSGYAMSDIQVNEALQKGALVVEEIFNNGCNTIGFGEMGIGNTSSASLIMHHYTGLPLEACIGRGTGANDAQMKSKLNSLSDAAAYHELATYDITPTRIMQSVAGFEMVMMAGAYIKAYELGMVILVDGFIATAALYLAMKHYNQPPEKQVSIDASSVLLQNCIFAHTSGEQGHLKMLEKIGATPLLNLGMRLGEGTGAAIAIPILQSACAFVNHMASFDSADVSKALAE